MLDRGAFDGLHAAMMIHPGPADAARAEPFAVDHQHISYRGTTAHAAAYPELGVNAADAFTIAQVAIGLLRQQLPASVRVHGIVTHAGHAPNAIPDQAEGRWYVRAASLAELDRIEPRVRACFQAGALASPRSTTSPSSPRTAPHRPPIGPSWTAPSPWQPPSSTPRPATTYAIASCTRPASDAQIDPPHASI